MARLALRPDDLIAPAFDALLEADVLLEAGVMPLEAEARRSGAHRLGFRILYPLLHTARVMGYAPLLLGSLARWPRRTLSAVACYYTLRFRSATWRRAVVGMARLGSSRRPRLLRCQTRPYANAQYLVAAHPHGILNYGWWNLISRFGQLALLDGLRLVMCMAPAVQWYPVYGEIFEDRATDASAASVRRVLKAGLTPAIIPGGFSEAVYTNAHPTEEYAYLAERTGFVRLAIERGVDIIPAYSYGLNDMYTTWGWARHWRAVKAQAWGIPMLMWWGHCPCSNVPDVESVTVATFDAFPASRYSLDQIPEAHAAYCAHLKACFDSRKDECGAGHKELVFIGSRQPPQPPPALRSRL